MARNKAGSVSHHNANITTAEKNRKHSTRDQMKSVSDQSSCVFPFNGLEEIIGQIQSSIAVASESEYLVYANEHALNLFGYSGLNEVLGKSVSAFLQNDIDLSGIVRQVKNEGVWKGHLPGRKKDGSPLHLSTTVSYLPGQDKQPKAFLIQIETEKAHALSECDCDSLYNSFKETSLTLNTVLDSIPDIIGIQDLEHRIIRYNKAGYEFLGKEPADAIGKRCFELIGRSRPCSNCSCEMAIKSRAPSHKIKHFKDLGIWFDIRSYPIFSESGEMVRVIEHLRDITLEKDREIELKNSRSQLARTLNTLESLLAAIPEGVFWKDTDLNYIGCNKAFAKLIRVGKTEKVSGLDDYDILTEESALNVRGKDNIVLNTGKNLFGVHEEVTFLDGRTIHFHTSRTPLYNAEDEMIGVLCVLFNVSELIHTQSALKQSREDYRNLIETLPLPMILVREDKIVLINPEAVNALGGKEEKEFIGTPFKDLLAPEYVSTMLKRLYEQGEDSGLSEHIELKLIRKDKQLIDIMLRNSIIDFQGERMHQLTFWDVTEIRELEQQQRQLEAQYRQSQKMEVIGKLAGGMAHDFNNLLTAIIGTAELAKLSPMVDDALQEDLEDILLASRKASRLTSRLLAFSRKQIISPVVINFRSIIEGMNMLLRRTIGEDVELEVAIDDSLWNVRADSNQVEQIIANLAVNARDAMPMGGSIQIKAENIPLEKGLHTDDFNLPAGEYVRFSIKDNGIGMSSEIREHIFEPFFTTKSEGKGTGMGLSMVYGAVKQNGGFIQVESTFGDGSLFSVYFPRCEEEVIDAIPEKGKPVDLKGTETILVAEDNRIVRNKVRDMLSWHGYTVLLAKNGHEGYELVKNGAEPDLILSDVIMPGISGPEMIEKLESEGFAFPTVFMSGYTENLIVNRGVLQEGIEFVQKPFNQEEVIGAIRRVLNETKQENS